MGGIARLVAGLPTQGRNLAVDSVEPARELDHPFSLALALSFSGTSHLFLGEPELVATRMDELSQVVNNHGFVPIKPNLDMLRGWARIAVDGDSSGIQIMEDGLAQLEKLGMNRLSFQLAILADAFRRLGSAEPAMSAIGRAIDVVESTNERRWESEIHRLKGELLEAGDADGAKEAEASYRRAVEVAHGQGAKWFELRAATSLARLWGEDGRREEAREVLAPVYGWFTEGFETADLRDAKALLGELG
jgi:predicted ATPase